MKLVFCIKGQDCIFMLFFPQYNPVKENTTQVIQLLSQAAVKRYAFILRFGAHVTQL